MENFYVEHAFSEFCGFSLVFALSLAATAKLKKKCVAIRKLCILIGFWYQECLIYITQH